MSSKYYVSCDGKNRIVLAENEVNAVTVFYKHTKNTDIDYSKCKVSERGFDEHDEDVWLNGDAIIELIEMPDGDEDDL